MCYVRYKNKEEDVRIIVAGRYELVKRVVIYQEMTDKKIGVTIELPSVLNGYLEKYKNNASTSNAKNAADTICTFLNYCKNEVELEPTAEFEILKKKGLGALNFYHAASFLNECIEEKKISYSTSMQYTERILDFYQFLTDLGILDKKTVHFTYTSYDVLGQDERERKRNNPFKNAKYLVSYPDKNKGKKRKLNNIDEYLWQLFLKASEKVAPNITLGIAFQLFGGLRRGEVINLALEDIIHEIKRDPLGIKKDSTKMDIVIKDRQMEFFIGRNVDLSKCGVKQPGEQQIFNFNGKLYDYYNNHIESRNKILAQNSVTTSALFVDNNGLPMSGKQFEQNWTRVKNKFLKILEEDSFKHYNELTNEVRWSTHIGRGIFTNLCLGYGLAKDVRTLANLRRDAKTTSSQPYIDNFYISKQIVKSLEHIASDLGW